MLKSTAMVDGRVDGSVIGGMTGEMKGVMKMARFLYLKGSELSDGRDSHKMINRRIR